MMEKILEEYLWNETGYVGEYKTSSHDVINYMVSQGWINNRKQAIRTLDKWQNAGKWDYGCNIEFGWKIKNEE